MLRYKGTLQPPRKYTVPDGPTLFPPRNPCSICLTRVWTPDLFASLSETPSDKSSVLVRYTISSHELRKSVVEGCGFCRTIADGVNGRVFLDELYARFENTDSWPGSIASNKNGTDNENEAADDEKDDDEGWNDASAFNEEELEDETGGWDVWEDRDTLSEECNLLVELSFERGDGELFTFMNAKIETDREKSDNSNVLHKLHSDKAIQLRYHINLDSNDCLEGKGLFPDKPINDALGSVSNMKTIKNWMHNLGEDCNSSDTISHLPARLIDLRSEGDLRIIETLNSPQSSLSFVALSYVWGTNQSFVLSSSNKKSLMKSFKFEKLPQTIRDAVTVTRHIGLRYIWVDALCIIQDSNEDKSRELPRMRSIYKCASVTIVAAVANSASEGFLHHPEEPLYFIEPISIPYRPYLTDDRQANIIISYPADYKRWKDPINDRAWTFQELLLSTRAIIFSYRGISTIDRTNRPSAHGMTSGKDPQLPNLPWNGLLFSLSQNPVNARQIWLAVRGEYSRRNLSYQGDKLLAISAIAEELGHSYRSRYLAGMWESNLAEELQWSCLPSENTEGPGIIKRKPRPKEYVAPSWSWASVDANVSASMFFEEDGADEDGRPFKGTLDFEVISCHVELSVPSFDYGAVKSGVLKVRGRLCVLIWRPHEEGSILDNQETDGFLVINSACASPLYSEETVGGGVVDALDPELHDGVLVTCIATRLFEDIPGKDQVDGLMLLAVDEEYYRRVGSFRLTINGSGPFMHSTLKVVSIV